MEHGGSHGAWSMAVRIAQSAWRMAFSALRQRRPEARNLSTQVVEIFEGMLTLIFIDVPATMKKHDNIGIFER
jgi:hypothetical protein